MFMQPVDTIWVSGRMLMFLHLTQHFCFPVMCIKSACFDLCVSCTYMLCGIDIMQLRCWNDVIKFNIAETITFCFSQT